MIKILAEFVFLLCGRQYHCMEICCLCGSGRSPVSCSLAQQTASPLQLVAGRQRGNIQNNNLKNNNMKLVHKMLFLDLVLKNVLSHN